MLVYYVGNRMGQRRVVVCLGFEQTSDLGTRNMREKVAGEKHLDQWYGWGWGGGEEGRREGRGWKDGEGP